MADEVGGFCQRRTGRRIGEIISADIDAAVGAVGFIIRKLSVLVIVALSCLGPGELNSARGDLAPVHGAIAVKDVDAENGWTASIGERRTAAEDDTTARRGENPRHRSDRRS